MHGLRRELAERVTKRRYPRAIDPAKVGRYAAAVKAGGGYVWDDVLYPKALACSQRTPGAEEP